MAMNRYPCELEPRDEFGIIPWRSIDEDRAPGGEIFIGLAQGRYGVYISEGFSLAI
jgi:hypothetical protein